MSAIQISYNPKTVPYPDAIWLTDLSMILQYLMIWILNESVIQIPNVLDQSEFWMVKSSQDYK